MKRITILLVEDDPLGREGLRKDLDLETDVEVIGEAKNGRAAVALAIKLRPDVILMNMKMPGHSGSLTARQVRKVLPDTKLIILTTQPTITRTEYTNHEQASTRNRALTTAQWHHSR